MNLFSTMTALPHGVISFVREARQELTTVQWPTRRDTVRSTVVILVVSLVVAAVTGMFDFLLTIVVERGLL